MKEKELQRLTELKQIEENLHSQGIEYICGIDEAGRGPLAGPVVVAAAIMPKDSMIEGVNDSKKVSEKKRELLYEKITEEAIAWGVGIIDQKEIDRINILNATKEGLTEAVKALVVRPDRIIVDALNGIDTVRNTIHLNNKRRRKMLLNSSSLNNSEGNKGQNNAPVGRNIPWVWLRKTQRLRNKSSHRSNKRTRLMPITQAKFH